MASGVLLPSFVHGTYSAVRRACRAAAARVAKGALFAELPERWLDVAEMPGYILTEGPKAATRSDPHYQSYALIAALPEVFAGGDDPRWEAVFSEMLTLPWLIYGCMSSDGYHLFRTEDRARRFVVAVRAQWETLTRPGQRFLEFAGHPRGFWPVARILHHCLRVIGAPTEELRAAVLDPAYQDDARPPVLDRYG